MKKLCLAFLFMFFLASPVWAANVTLSWDAVTGASGYKLYASVDQGATWGAGQDVGLVTEYTLTGQPDSGLVLYRVSAYSASGETIRTWSGAWFNADWKPPESPGGAGIQ